LHSNDHHSHDSTARAIKKYEREKLDRSQLATDIENTAVVLSPLIPWNIAGLVPMTDSGFIPYAVYLYLLPLCNSLS